LLYGLGHRHEQVKDGAPTFKGEGLGSLAEHAITDQFCGSDPFLGACVSRDDESRWRVTLSGCASSARHEDA
jgi:hypothetical protein